jgi:DNA adenine methylase
MASLDDFRYVSPLRYPGGKATLAPFIARLISSQPRRPQQYVEPFAGGAGAALRLLVDEHVEHLVLNDIDGGVAAFWRAVFHHTDELIRRVVDWKVSLASWRRHRAMYMNKRGDDVELGFATLFLNRSNGSGILDAWPIGGLSQDSKWGITARFNPESLAARIRRLGTYASRVTLCEEDGVALIDRYLGDRNSFVYADPPYLQKGDGLYLDTLDWSDHERLAKKLRKARQWFLTYDADPRVPDALYRGLRCAAFGITHTTRDRHFGKEYAVFAPGLNVPSLDGLGQDARWLRRKGRVRSRKFLQGVSSAD